MTLNEVADLSFAIAKSKGWCDREVPVPEQVALLHTEASEIMEAFRNSEPVSWTDEKGKPQGIGSELADLVIRVGHYAVLNNVDLEYEVNRKLAYNKTRPFRHGGKAA